MKVSAIFSSDWHVTSSIPICRKDNYFKAQRKKIRFILNLAVQHKCPIFVAGDIGNKAQWKNWLLAKTITLGKLSPFQQVKIYVIAGQHDLPYHNLDLVEESGLWVLNQAGFLRILNEPTDFGSFVVCPFHFGEKIESWHSHRGRTVALIHQLVCQKGSQEWEKKTGVLAEHLLRKFPCYDLIVSGDNHIPFHIEYPNEDAILLNCGSLMREEISQIYHKPAVYLWNAEDNIIQRVFVPVEKDVFDISLHSFKHEKKEVELFVKNLHSAEGFKLNFQSNMQSFFKRNAEKIKRSVRNKILSTFDNN